MNFEVRVSSITSLISSALSLRQCWISFQSLQLQKRTQLQQMRVLMLNVPDELCPFNYDRHSLLRCFHFISLELNIAHEVLLRDVNVEHLNLVVKVFDVFLLLIDFLVQQCNFMHTKIKFE